jgi:hypothetical protein
VGPADVLADRGHQEQVVDRIVRHQEESSNSIPVARCHIDYTDHVVLANIVLVMLLSHTPLSYAAVMSGHIDFVQAELAIRIGLD